MNLREQFQYHFGEYPFAPPWVRRIESAYFGLREAEITAGEVLGSFRSVRYLEQYSEGSIKQEYAESLINDFQIFLGQTKDDLPQAIFLDKYAPKYKAKIIDCYYLPRTNKFCDVHFQEFPSIEITSDPNSPSFLVDFDTVGETGDISVPVPGTKIKIIEGIIPGNRYVVDAETIAKRLDETLPEESIARPYLSELLEKIKKAKEQERQKREEAEDYFVPQIRQGVLQLRDAVAAKFRLPDFIELGDYYDPEEGKVHNHIFVFFDTKGGKLITAPIIVRKKTFLRGKKREPDLTQAQDAPMKEWINIAKTGAAWYLLDPVPDGVKIKFRE